MPDNPVSRIQRNDSLVCRTLYDWQFVGRYHYGSSCDLWIPSTSASHKGHCIRPFQCDKVPDNLIMAELYGRLSGKEVSASLRSLSDRGQATYEGKGDHFSRWWLPDGRSLWVVAPNCIPYESLSDRSVDLLRKQFARWPQDQFGPFGPAKCSNGSPMWGVVVLLDDECYRIQLNSKGECGQCYRLTAAGIERAERDYTGSATDNESQTDAQTPAPGSPLTTNSVATKPVPKRPSEDAIKAWRLRDLEGLKTQTAIADRMSNELGRKINQGMVSRWLKQVEDYLEAGNIFPELPGLTKEPLSIDSADIEMGERRDHRTPRQRHRRDPDSD